MFFRENDTPVLIDQAKTIKTNLIKALKHFLCEFNNVKFCHNIQR